ncbi:3-oxoacyl-[acyl-carrier-protein] reductase FabG-like [Gossypium australe]|uniref:3-oxoacyl-[acyl-carrier-protein] reductase FabG-like n=1 Tax=Gossypium australe TaxID=47621 RepID=A0A5B6XA17_9ROSI|nr:3-oxoacyl-[acyl-carrier-protein] reductase FabG-like [Gossypium australe]
MERKKPVPASFFLPDLCETLSSLSRSFCSVCGHYVGNLFIICNYYALVGNVKDPLELTEEEWNQNIRTNLTGSWLVSKYVCMLMRDAKQGGSVINISSIAGLNRGQLPGGLAYASSKAGLNAMTKMF